MRLKLMIDHLPDSKINKYFVEESTGGIVENINIKYFDVILGDYISIGSYSSEKEPDTVCIEFNHVDFIIQINNLTGKSFTGEIGS